MDELSSIFNNLGLLVAVVGGGISVVAIGYAGIQWMTSSGDPQKMGQARMGLMGAVGGLVIVGIAFIIPRVVSQAVIEPVGGVSLQSEAGTNCDQILRNQLVFQRGASTAANMNVVISQIQAQRDTCTSETWDPEVDNGAYEGVAGVADDPATPLINEAVESAKGCFDAGATEGLVELGDTEVPRSLHDENDEEKAVRNTSGRDSNNNIIVYWGKPGKRPTDNSVCWLYVSRLRVWDENY